MDRLPVAILSLFSLDLRISCSYVFMYLCECRNLQKHPSGPIAAARKRLIISNINHAFKVSIRFFPHLDLLVISCLFAVLVVEYAQ